VISPLAILKSGDFVTRTRLVLWPGALLVGFVVALAFLAATARGFNDYQGRPLGSDFSDVYTAGRWADQGDAAAAYDPLRQHIAEQASFGRNTPFYGWHYPPIFFLIAAPLAQLPYLGALAVWQVATLLAWLAALARLLRDTPAVSNAEGKIRLLLAVAFPAVFVNLIHGHNGFLTGAFLSGGLALLDTQPLVAGALFGCLAYKPQFAPLIPLALAVSGRWRALIGASATALGLAALATVLFGASVWPAFLASTHFTRTVVLEQGAAGFEKIQSVFAAVRLLGGPVALAYTAQMIASCVTAILLALLWRSDASRADKGAALCLAALIATPYAFDYDMMALAPAIALLATQGIARGFRPYEKSALVLLWFVPILARASAYAAHVPLGVLSLFAMGAVLMANAKLFEVPARIRSTVSG
jgi:hypothetical protein